MFVSWKYSFAEFIPVSVSIFNHHCKIVIRCFLLMSHRLIVLCRCYATHFIDVLNVLVVVEVTRCVLWNRLGMSVRGSGMKTVARKNTGDLFRIDISFSQSPQRWAYGLFLYIFYSCILWGNIKEKKSYLMCAYYANFLHVYILFCLC